jgi:CRISPR-associated protein Csx3
MMSRLQNEQEVISIILPCRIPTASPSLSKAEPPIWRNGMALHKLHSLPAAAIAFYDLRLGAVIVAGHNPAFTLGQVIDVTIPEEK